MKFSAKGKELMLKDSKTLKKTGAKQKMGLKSTK